MTTVDVLVVGGGPVGAMLACELRLGGASVVVLEKSATPNTHSKAFRLQPRTMELLDQRNLLERFLANNKQWPYSHFAGIKPLLDLGRLDSEHPYSLLIPQARTEALLEARAVELGADVRRGHEVVGLRQDDDGVTVDVRCADGDYELTADYLVGCDGGHSTVRKLAGIDFPGTQGTVSALLGDVVLADPSQLPAGVPGTSRTSAGLLMAVALEDGVTRVLTTEFTGTRAQHNDEVTVTELRAAIRRVLGTDVGIDDARWTSHFSNATRLAAAYRDRRVLLAGDAAHVHFPIGAQGLNLGLQDAVNLGWKLAASIAGWAPAGLLDSYQSERQPAAKRVLRETQAQLALMNPDEQVNPLRELFGELLGIAEVNFHLSALVAGTDVRYEVASDNANNGDSDHPLLGKSIRRMNVTFDDGHTKLAELLRSGRGVLIDFEDTAQIRELAAEWSNRIDHIVGKAPKGDNLSTLLIRPDGHVAWAGRSGTESAEVDAVRSALTKWFGTPGEVHSSFHVNTTRTSHE